MKEILSFFGFLMIAFLFVECTASKSAAPTVEDDAKRLKRAVKYETGKNSTETESNSTLGLDGYLRRLAGVTVSGSGGDARVRVRVSGQTPSGSSAPLFVINGQQVGNNFSIVYNIISVNDIKKVRVLKNTSELGRYGMLGSNGVIEITTQDK